VASRSEVLANGSIRRKKALGMSLRLQSLHALLPLAGRLMGVFGALVEIAMVAVLHPSKISRFAASWLLSLSVITTRGT
jgi:hypothetical protein